MIVIYFHNFGIFIIYLVCIKTNIGIKFELEKLTNLKYSFFLSRHRKLRLIEIQVMEVRLYVEK